MFYMICVDQATNDELNAIQAIVKENAHGWWHHFTSIWIVGGHNASFWRDQATPLLTSPSSSVLVVRLPQTGERYWSYFGIETEKRLDWLNKNLRSDSA